MKLLPKNASLLSLPPLGRSGFSRSPPLSDLTRTRDSLISFDCGSDSKTRERCQSIEEMVDKKKVEA